MGIDRAHGLARIRPPGRLRISGRSIEAGMDWLEPVWVSRRRHAPHKGLKVECGMDMASRLIALLSVDAARGGPKGGRKIRGSMAEMSVLTAGSTEAEGCARGRSEPGKGRRGIADAVQGCAGFGDRWSFTGCYR